MLSPLLFSIVIEKPIRKCKDKCANTKFGMWQMKQIQLQELLFADDMVVIANIEISKTKTMIIPKHEKRHKIELSGQTLQVTRVNY